MTDWLPWRRAPELLKLFPKGTVLKLAASNTAGFHYTATCP